MKMLGPRPYVVYSWCRHCLLSLRVDASTIAWSAKLQSALYPLVRSHGPQLFGPQFTPLPVRILSPALVLGLGLVFVLILVGRSIVYAPSEILPYITAKPFTRCQH